MKLILLILNLVLLNSCGASKQDSLTNSNENAMNREKVTLSGTYKIVVIDENETLPDDLTISFEKKDGKYRNIFLKGPAIQVFKGTIECSI